MSQQSSASPKKSRRATIRALRQQDSEGRVPQFLTPKEEKKSSKKPFVQGVEKVSFRDMSERKKEQSHDSYAESDFSFSGEGLSGDIEKRLKKNKGGCVIVMSKTALIGIIFGLILMGGLLFGAGLLSGYSLLKQEENSVVSVGDIDVNLPKPPTMRQNIRSAVEAVGDLVGLDLSKEDEAKVKEGAQKVPTDDNAGGFSIQARVLRDQLPAMELARALKASDYGSYVVRHRNEQTDEVTYHVRLGAYGDYVAANELARFLRGKNYESSTVILIRRGEERLLP
ncbi:MAG: SPOR domain-containing protein [bacterium]|nr:SPOR domain-containing protein [bacterium]